MSSSYNIKLSWIFLLVSFNIHINTDSTHFNTNNCNSSTITCSVYNTVALLFSFFFLRPPKENFTTFDFIISVIQQIINRRGPCPFSIFLYSPIEFSAHILSYVYKYINVYMTFPYSTHSLPQL